MAVKGSEEHGSQANWHTGGSITLCYSATRALTGCVSSDFALVLLQSPVNVRIGRLESLVSAVPVNAMF